MCVSETGPLYDKKRNVLTSDKLEMCTILLEEEEEINFIEIHDSYKKLLQKYLLYNYCTYCIIQKVIL